MKYPDWLPYFGPMVVFIGLVSLSDALASLGPWNLVIRFVLPLAAFLYFRRQGCYPELRGWKPGAGALADVCVGLAVTAVWVAPYLLWPALRPDSSSAFDPAAWGAGWYPAAILFRFAGFAFVTPFIEELLVRSYLIREAEVFQEQGDYRTIPIGRFGRTGFIVTVLWFTFTHVQWEWPVAFATAVIYNLWLYKRKHIGSLILTHAATNASLFALVVWGSGAIPDGAGGFHDLWYFL